jgi:hypothetical protein
MQYLVPWSLCEQKHAISSTLKFVWADVCNIRYLEVCVSRSMQYQVPWSLCEQKYAISGTLKYVWAEVCNICTRYCMLLLTLIMRNQTLHISAHTNFKVPDIAYFCSHKLQGTWYCMLTLKFVWAEACNIRYLEVCVSRCIQCLLPWSLVYICSHKFQGNRHCIHLLTQTSRYLIVHASAHTNFKVPEICVSRCMQYQVPWSLCEQMYAISGTLKFVWAEACNIRYLEVCVSRSMHYQVPWSLCEQMAYICSHLFHGNRHCIHLLTQISR